MDMNTNLPNEIENKIFSFMSHPVADLLRGNVINLLHEEGYIEIYNFTSRLNKGKVSIGNKIPFQQLWNVGIILYPDPNVYTKVICRIIE